MNNKFEKINKISIIKLDQTKGDDKDMSDRMDDAIKKARSAYLREWRKNNPNKTKEYTKRYWEKRAMREQMQEKEMRGNAGDNKAVSNN